MKNEDQHNSKSEVSTTPSGTVYDNKYARCRMSANVNPSDSPPVSLSKLPMMSTTLSLSLASSVRLSLASTSSNALLTHSSSSMTTTSKSGTSCKLGIVLLSGSPSSIASSRSSLATLPPKGGRYPDLFVSCIHYFQ